MKYTFTPHGVCSRQIDVDIENGVVRSVQFQGGCNGNTQGVSSLCQGREAKELIALLRGIDCKGKGTSCPDQLSLALEEALAAEQAG